MTDTTHHSLSKRGLMIRMGIPAIAIGIVLLALGWWRWPWLTMFGWIVLALGVIWSLCSRWANPDPMQRAQRRYLRAAFPGLAGYVLAIIVLGVVDRHPLALWLRVLVAILPVLPMIWVMFAMGRLVHESDELERRIHHEAVFITCGVVGVLSFAAGMLELGGVVHIRGGLFFVLPAIFLVYGISRWCYRRKYGLSGIG